MENKNIRIPEELMQNIYSLYYEGLHAPLSEEEIKAAAKLEQHCFLGNYWFSLN